LPPVSQGARSAHGLELPAEQENILVTEFVRDLRDAEGGFQQAKGSQGDALFD
jgi:hypothetical protein